MPGILGIISYADREKNENDLDSMLNSMLHEPFYNYSKYIQEDLGLYLAWINIKDSKNDCLPIYNEDRTLILFFSGENFIDQYEIEKLKSEGHRFDPKDASYIIHLYEQNKKNFFRKLNGRFHGVLLDLQTQNIVLFNDRYGMQRVYYNENGGEFLFSSEAKSLLKIRPNLRKINEDGLGQFFSLGCVLDDKSLFSDVSLLPGGSKWIFTNNQRPQKEIYFRPEEWEGQPILEKEVFYKDLKSTFSSILPRYFGPDESIAVSLTGGLDTRIILANRKNEPGTLPCYTFGGMYRDCYDVKVAREVAKACHQEHKTLKLDKAFLSDIKNLAEKVIYLTDGYLDISGVPNLFVNKLAREIAPIRMTGNYGSELLRSVRAFKPNPPDKNLFESEFSAYVNEAAHLYDQMVKGHKLTFALFKQAPWYQYGRLSLEQSQLILRTPYLDNDLVKMMYQAPPEATESRDISLRLISDGNPELAKIPTDRGVGGDKYYIHAKALRGYREFLFKMEYYYNYGMPHWLAIIDRFLKQISLDKIFLGRHKYYHLRIWFRDEWSSYIREVLLNPRAFNRPYLNSAYAAKIVKGHLSGNYNYTYEIIKLLTVELIHRAFIDDL